MLAARSTKPRISFLAFFLLWAKRMRWDVPDLHVRACVWLEWFWTEGGDLGLLMLPRGHAKSTLLEVFNAWLYYTAPRHFLRILHQSESDGTALKTSRGTQNVLRHHPLTRGMLPDALGTIEQWWVVGTQEIDARNASMYAKGILSNTTSSRADFIQNDDIEVPRNIGTPEAREKLRYRLSEQVHIAVPGAPKLYIGTPHTHDSIYEDIKRLGADALIVRMFEQEFRIEQATERRYAVGFVPEYVFEGIGEQARLLVKDTDYRVIGHDIELMDPRGQLVDCYADAAWPERFHGAELEKRRRECRTINEWDSQYQLHAKPVGDVRLDPDKLVPYEVTPVVREANGSAVMTLGAAQIVGVNARWDVSLGKLDSDASAFTVMLTDAQGRRYWQHAEDIVCDADLDRACKRVRELVLQYSIPAVTVETNGPGGFVPAILRKHLRGTGSAVREEHSTANKNKRILDAFEPLLSTCTLWVHTDVLNGPVYEQMRDWNPKVKSQPDDYLDSAAGAILENPHRVARIGGNSPRGTPNTWRPSAGVAEVKFER